jgi:site-specific DNA recombinase
MVAPLLQELIAEAVLYRLDTPELADTLAGRAAPDEHPSALAEQLSAYRAQLDELAGLYAERAISSREWLTARNAIEERVNHAQRQLARASHSDALASLVGNEMELPAQRASLNLTRQHAIVAAILDHAIIAPGVPGARSLNRARVTPIWRL